MAAKKATKKRKASLDTILSTVERGFAAVAGDIADIKSTMATKADVRNIVGEELAPIRAELKSIRFDLDDLKEKVENVTGFHKEIDYALEGIAKIEEHLGFDKKIAAQPAKLPRSCAPNPCPTRGIHGQYRSTPVPLVTQCIRVITEPLPLLLHSNIPTAPGRL